MKLLIITLTFIIVNSTVKADYLVTGQIRGFVCKSWIFIDKCKYVNIDAVDDKTGKLYSLAKVYEDVSEYNDVGDYKICHIYVKPNKTDTLGKVFHFINKINKGDNFYTKDKSGKHEKVDPESLQFKCIKK